MDWKSNEQFAQKREDYVKGIANHFEISEFEARQLELQLWNKANSIAEYTSMLKEKFTELFSQKQFAVQQSQQQQQQMYAHNPGK